MKNSVFCHFQAIDGLGVIVRSKQHLDGSQVLSWLGLRERHAADVFNFPGLGSTFGCERLVRYRN